MLPDWPSGLVLPELSTKLLSNWPGDLLAELLEGLSLDWLNGRVPLDWVKGIILSACWQAGW